MSANKGTRFNLFKKIAPNRKVNTHISQYYRKDGERRDSEESIQGHKESVGCWTSFKHIFSPLSFQTHREKNSNNRRPKMSNDMVLYHQFADRKENAEEAGDDVFGDGNEKGKDESEILVEQYESKHGEKIGVYEKNKK